MRKYNKDKQMQVHDVFNEIYPKGWVDSINTVATRFRSKYAKERWGVQEIMLPDGTVNRFADRDKLNLWNVPVGLYRRRPKIN